MFRAPLAVFIVRSPVDLVNFVFFQAFLLYIHYMRENVGVATTMCIAQKRMDLMSPN